MMPSKLDRDPDLAQQLVEEYRAGARLHVLACQHRVGWEALRRTILAHGVEIRPPCKHVRTFPTGKRSRRGPLSDEEVERLRKLIGYDPSWADRESE